MIAGLDSSAARPTLAQARAARAAGVRVWGGYLPPGVGLESPWDQASFEIVQSAGLGAIGFASGNDDPAQVAATAKAWRVHGCLDDEVEIRVGTGWQQDWLDASGFGRYGLCAGATLRARFHVVARYPGFDPGATWDPTCPDPGAPHGWQWQGTHTDPATGLSVDSLWLDDWFLQQGGSDMAAAPRLDGSAVDYFAVQPDGTLEHWTWTFATGMGPGENLGGSLLPHTLSAFWLGAELVLFGQAPGGVVQQLVYDGAWTWSATAAAGALPPRGPAGATGPPGPATYVRHSHQAQTDTGAPIA